jgi:hypothetical protein
MRLRIVANVAFLTATATTRALLTSDSPSTDFVIARQRHDTATDHAPLLWSDSVTAVTAASSKWDEAVQSGANLFFGMQSDDRKASFFFKTDPHVKDPTIQTVQSSHDGDMKEEFIKWGYNEDEAENVKIDKECDFETYHKIKRAFDELGIRTESKANKGPNQCVQLDHQNGPKVVRDKDNKLPPIDQQKYIDDCCGKEYRVSMVALRCLDSH